MGEGGGGDRKLRIQIEALARLGKAGVGFASVNDPFDATTPQGRLMLNQMGSWNEFFSDPRAFMCDGAYTDNEYDLRLADIDRQLQQVCPVASPAIEEAAELFSDIPTLWNEATVEERQRLLNPFVELVYVDLQSRRVEAFTPTLAFRALFSTGMETAPDAPIRLIPPGEAPGGTVGVGGDGGESNHT